MRRSTTKYLLSLGLFCFGSLALAPGCDENNSSLFIVGVIDLSASSCLAKPDTTVVTLAGGTLDVAFSSSYSVFLLVGNQLTQRGSREQLRTETSRIALRGAEVTLTTLDGKTTLGTYSTAGTGFVNQAAGDVPSYAAMAVNLIPPALGVSETVQAARVVLAKIRVFGDTLGNASITSNELDFPINICRGCLVRYDSRDPTQPTYKCTTGATAMQTTAAPPCILGQDQPFSCTVCSATYPVCLDPSLNPAFAPAP